MSEKPDWMNALNNLGSAFIYPGIAGVITVFLLRSC